MEANISKNDYVKGEVEEVTLVDDVNSLEIGGYVAKELIKDVAMEDNLTDGRSIFSKQSRGMT